MLLPELHKQYVFVICAQNSQSSLIIKNCKDGSVVTVGGNDTLTNSYVFTRDTSANIRVEKTKHIFGERNKIAEAVCFISFNKSTHKASS